MPTKQVKYIIEDLNDLKKSFNKHLEESIGIKVQLKVNTALTGIILAAVIGKICVDMAFR